MQLSGYHHVTTLGTNMGELRRFYCDVMGMRMVKRSVNFDNPGRWHLYFADDAGTPGTNLSILEWSGDCARGTNEIIRLGLQVAPDSLDYWAARLRGAGLDASPDRAGGREELAVSDPSGVRLRLVPGEDGVGTPWPGSPVPPQMQVRGLGPVTISVHELAPTRSMLIHVLNMRPIGEVPDADGNGVAHAYGFGDGGAELHVVVRPDLPPARYGAGAIHHVAFRVPDTTTLERWLAHLSEDRVNVSPVFDRVYFRSIYFREPGGNLLEIATDDPGFTLDEPRERLGSKLRLPPWLAERRAEIAQNLSPLR